MRTMEDPGVAAQALAPLWETAAHGDRDSRCSCCVAGAPATDPNSRSCRHANHADSRDTGAHDIAHTRSLPPRSPLAFRRPGAGYRSHRVGYDKPRLSAVIQSQSLVELVEVAVARLSRLGGRVAWQCWQDTVIALPCLIAQADDARRTLRCADMHRMVRGCNRCWFGFGRWRRVMIRGDSRATARSGQRVRSIAANHQCNGTRLAQLFTSLNSESFMLRTAKG